MYCTKCDKELDTKFCPYCGSETEPTVTKEESIDNKSLIDNLYALRAGLSKVSLEMDKVKKTETELNKVEFSNKQIIETEKGEYGNVNYFSWMLNSIKADFNKKISQQNSQLNNHKHYVSQAEKNFKSKRNLIFFMLGIMGICVIGLIAILVAPLKGDAISVVALPAIPLFILSMVMIKQLVDLAELREKLKKERNELTSYLNANSKVLREDDIYSNPKYIEYAGLLEKAKKDLAQAKNFDYLPYKKAIEKQQNECSNFYKEFYNTYLSSFINVLDERDWKNLDLIIFILETHRADTLKEALQQVDMYRHTEKIARAIENASLAICNTIRQESDRISLAIGNCVDTINSRLQIIADNQNVLSKELNSVNDNIKKSINATELQNALIAKSNETSEQMAMDIARIREFEGRPYGHI